METYQWLILFESNDDRLELALDGGRIEFIRVPSGEKRLLLSHVAEQKLLRIV